MKRALLSWYDSSGRTLPWRVRPEDRAAGIVADPYRVWLSEIMLQQTTVAAATPYYHRFLERFPTVFELASAPREEVLSLWAGLGYYARARNLHACAQHVVGEGGAFPSTELGLRELPGIGAYTAAAIAASCFDQPANVVDGNVERVMARLFAVESPLPNAKKELAGLAAHFVDDERPGDYAQAIMDLGAVVCRPRNPSCDQCPWRAECAAFKSNDPLRYPRKKPKQLKPQRFGASFVAFANDAVLLRRRPEAGLLAAMSEPPGAPWRDDPWTVDEALAHAPLSATWRQCAEPARHVFTHFALEVIVFVADVTQCCEIAGHWWADLNALDAQALPSVMHKVIGVARREHVTT